VGGIESITKTVEMGSPTSQTGNEPKGIILAFTLILPEIFIQQYKLKKIGRQKNKLYDWQVIKAPAYLLSRG